MPAWAAGTLPGGEHGPRLDTRGMTVGKDPCPGPVISISAQLLLPPEMPFSARCALFEVIAAYSWVSLSWSRWFLVAAAASAASRMRAKVCLYAWTSSALVTSWMPVSFSR